MCIDFLIKGKLENNGGCCRMMAINGVRILQKHAVGYPIRKHLAKKSGLYSYSSNLEFSTGKLLKVPGIVMQSVAIFIQKNSKSLEMLYFKFSFAFLNH